MTQVQAAIVSPDGVTLVIENQTTPIASSHPNYSEIRSLAASGIYDGIPALLDLVTPIVDFGAGLVTVKDGVVLYKDNPTHNAVTTRILSMVEEGLSVDPMFRFLERLMLNPSFRAVKELYGFMEANDLPITSDGYLTAYKMVTRKDDGTLTDSRTGTFDYSVGAPAAEMPRNEVNEDPEQTCSAGLHVCAQEYLSSGYTFGAVTILVKVDPADVVAVPTDYHNAKMRVCKHETIRELDPNTKGFAFTSAVLDEDAMDEVVQLADDSTVLTHEAALAHFDCNAGALRKRLNRGVSAKRIYQGGVEMVQIIEVDTAPAPVADEPVDDTISVDEAMAHFDCDRAALRKRCVRGVTAEWAYDFSGEERVRILDTE